MRPIFSPRETLAVKLLMTVVRRRKILAMPFELRAHACPEGRFMSKRMNGRAMLDRASSLVCRRSTSFLRDVTWLERVPAEKRAMNSFNCAIFFSRCAFWASMRERICVFASTMSS